MTQQTFRRNIGMPPLGGNQGPRAVNVSSEPSDDGSERQQIVYPKFLFFR
jgi:hypothetical protein